MTASPNIQVRLVLPSDGDLHAPTLDFMKACGLEVRRPSARRYTGAIPVPPGGGGPLPTHRRHNHEG